MNYLRPKWVHTLGGKAYADGWERTFGKKAKCPGCVGKGLHRESCDEYWPGGLKKATKAK